MRTVSVFESAINLLLKEWKKESAQPEQQILAALTHTNQLLAQLVAATGQQPAGQQPAGFSAPGQTPEAPADGGRSRWRR